jgi:hypothetical protein
VASGGQVADFPALYSDELALYVPAVDSCTAALKASWDQTSANFLPVKGYGLPTSGGVSPTSLADVVVPFGPGGAYFALDYNLAAALPNLRVVLGVAQTAPRTLCIVAKWDRN